ncbi:MAG: carbohydrate kinase [Chitinophagaceae bacterium]|nr:MAG: carbohydrate kinase [Chitinophagaceae bacterium]
MSQTDFDSLFKAFSNIKAGVIGDVMLDTYLWGHVERISPEAPVPVVALDKKEQRIGGAGNVALNLRSLGAQVSVISTMGEDEDGNSLRGLFESNNIDTGYLLQSNSRITTNKSRVISRNQQMMRLDAEITKDLSAADEASLFSAIERYVETEKPAVIIFEDYNKGVLTEKLISNVIELCKKHGVVTTVDPKRKNFFSYKGVNIFKPNLKEVKDGLNLLIEDINEPVLGDIHDQLHEQLGHEISFITLSEKGVFYKSPSEQKIIPTHIRNIADVSGAGDTVIAVASLVYATTGRVDLMAEIANIAGGLVCEIVGTAAINKNELLKECKELLGARS